MAFSCKIYCLSFPSCEKRGLSSAGKGSQASNRTGALQKPSLSKGKDYPVSPLMVSLCFHRQGAGPLCYGPQPLSHAGLGLPDDLQEHDRGGCH